MAKPAPFVDDALCARCQPCPVLKTCKVRALFRMDGDDAPFVDAHRCNGCLICVPACEYGAIRAPSRVALFKA